MLVKHPSYTGPLPGKVGIGIKDHSQAPKIGSLEFLVQRIDQIFDTILDLIDKTIAQALTLMLMIEQQVHYDMSVV